TPSDDLATVWNGLIKSPEWRLTFADRLQKHFFTPGGALTEENLTRRLEEVESEIAEVMDFAGPNINTGAIKTWISGREKALFNSGKQFEDDDLWGQVQVPSFSPSGGAIDAGTTMKISVGSIFSPQKGDIYYTTDGSDPRLVGGLPNPDAILYDRDANTGIVIDTTATIKARVHFITLFEPAGFWSALA
ncbi:MAG: FN3 associated domain-containing protein, partial [Verrucomicrobiales bacterium]